MCHQDHLKGKIHNMKKANEKKVEKKLPPLEEQKPLFAKKGKVVKIVVFDNKNEAGIVEMKVTKVYRANVRKTKYGDEQLFKVVLKPLVKGITIDGEDKIELWEHDPALVITDWAAVQNAIRTFKYESKEERLLRAIFGEDNGNEAMFRSLIRLAAKVEKATRKDFIEEQKAWAKEKAQADKEAEEGK